MRTDKGFTLVVVLLVVAMISILIGLSSAMLDKDLKLASNDRFTKQAFIAAENGVEEARGRLQAGTSNTVPDATPGDPDWKAFMGTQSKCQDLGYDSSNPKHFRYDALNANFAVRVSHKVDASSKVLYWNGAAESTTTSSRNIYLVTSNGWNNTVSKTINAEFRRTSISVFDYALFGGTRLTMNGSGYTDSYNSKNGAWPSRGFYKNGNIGTNSTASKTLTLTGTETIYGSVAVGPGGNPAVVESLTGTINITGGSIVEVNAKDMTPQSAPAVGTTTPVTINLNSGGQTLTGGVYSASSVMMNGSPTLTISGNVTLVVSGNFTMNGTPVVDVTPGSSFTLIVSGSTLFNGSTKIQNSASFNLYANGDVTLNGNQTATNQDPSKFLVWGTNPTSQNITLNGSSQIYGAVYAPKAAITFNGSQDMFGSYIGKTVLVNGLGNIHYDEALGLLNTGGMPGPCVMSKWTESN